MFALVSFWNTKNFHALEETPTEGIGFLFLQFSQFFIKNINITFFQGVVIKYNEPPEARKPKTRWRLYPFKGEEAMCMYIYHTWP